MSKYDKRKSGRYFLLEDPSVSGYSGSPVVYIQGTVTNFIPLGNEPTICYGLIHGQLLDEGIGKFSLVVPSKYIVETIESVLDTVLIQKIPRSDGTLWCEREIYKGKLWNIISNYDENGNLVNKGTIQNGNGTIIHYHPNGTLHSEREYKNGLLWNVISLFDYNGKPLEIGTLKDGSGTFKIYYGNEYEKTRQYLNGEIIREFDFR